MDAAVAATNRELLVPQTGRICALLLALAAPPLCGGGANDDKPAAGRLTEDEQAVLDLTNAARAAAEKKLPPLKANPKLMEAARKHAANMAAQDKMEHVLDDKSPADRLKAAGYKYRVFGENIAWGAKGPKDVVAGWMDSEPHRENILKPEYTEIGVAVARNAKGEPYWVQVFGKR
jgi:uncharacterized protein YkwD